MTLPQSSALKWYTVAERIPQIGEKGVFRIKGYTSILCGEIIEKDMFRIKGSTSIGSGEIVKEGYICIDRDCLCCDEYFDFDAVELWAPFEVIKKEDK